MKQIFEHYEKWEDFKNGMFDITKKDNETELIKNAESLLKDEAQFYNTSIEMINKWVISSSVNLSHVSCNRKAWIGQAACSYLYSCPEILTRIAWKNISETERIKANNIADKIISIYETKNRNIHKNMANAMLF